MMAGFASSNPRPLRAIAYQIPFLVRIRMLDSIELLVKMGPRCPLAAIAGKPTSTSSGADAMLKKTLLPKMIITLIAGAPCLPLVATADGQDAKRDTIGRVFRASLDRDTDHKPSVLVTAATTGKFRTLINLLVAADLVSTLSEDGPFTVFAPSDEAFAKVPSADLAALLLPENKAKLKKILTLHVVPGRIKASVLASKGRVKTVNGARLNVAENRHGLAVGEATVVQADIDCDNGIIHVIDRLLLPTASSTDVLGLAESKRSFSVLIAAVKAAGLEDTLRGDGPFTILAPTDEAFGKLPHETLSALLLPANRAKLANLLKYHVIHGNRTAREVISAGRVKTLQGGAVEATIEDGRLAINEAKVLASDLKADNGIVHAIDAVLMPH